MGIRIVRFWLGPMRRLVSVRTKADWAMLLFLVGFRVGLDRRLLASWRHLRLICESLPGELVLELTCANEPQAVGKPRPQRFTFFTQRVDASGRSA